MINAFVLAGTSGEYNRVLSRLNLKGNECPRLTALKQLDNFITLPKVLLYGRWFDRHADIYHKLLGMEAELVRVDLSGVRRWKS
jgi:hypothetical protein